MKRDAVRDDKRRPGAAIRQTGRNMGVVFGSETMTSFTKPKVQMMTKPRSQVPHATCSHDGEISTCGR